ncbi:MAG: hypothetical protein PT944_01315 [Actinomycetaceae bacterium]|nr:hypothetical protein [Arcanobacterium sp.]MDD7686543.1 hypothetical protein [Actinomycetaceae bacterium]MDY5272823.1 hypothetical protein [Arcanobacterium sp.]
MAENAQSGASFSESAFSENETAKKMIDDALPQAHARSLEANLTESIEVGTSGESSKGGESRKGGLSQEDIEKIRKIQRRNIVVAALLGVILLICGFFAGRAVGARYAERATAACSVLAYECIYGNSDAQGSDNSESSAGVVRVMGGECSTASSAMSDALEVR